MAYILKKTCTAMSLNQLWFA